MGRVVAGTTGELDGWWARRRIDATRSMGALLLLRYLSVVIVAMAAAFIGSFPN